jgi:Leucine-rich repeat (LRR) protein
MEEMKKTEFDFIKIKTKKLIEILQELSNWRGGSKSEEAKKRVIAAYVTKSSSLDLSYLSLTSLPKCLSDFSHLSYLNCSHNLLTSLPFLPHLEVLNCSFNRIYFLPPFSDRVKINAAVNPYLQKL